MRPISRLHCSFRELSWAEVQIVVTMVAKTSCSMPPVLKRFHAGSVTLLVFVEIWQVYWHCELIWGHRWA